MWASTFLSPHLLPIPCVLSSNLHTNAGCVLAYIPSLVGGAFRIGYHIVKGVSERYIARLLLTISNFEIWTTLEIGTVMKS